MDIQNYTLLLYNRLEASLLHYFFEMMGWVN